MSPPAPHPRCDGHYPTTKLTLHLSPFHSGALPSTFCVLLSPPAEKMGWPSPFAVCLSGKGADGDSSRISWAWTHSLFLGRLVLQISRRVYARGMSWYVPKSKNSPFAQAVWRSPSGIMPVSNSSRDSLTGQRHKVKRRDCRALVFVRSQRRRCARRAHVPAARARGRSWT